MSRRWLLVPLTFLLGSCSTFETTVPKPMDDAFQGLAETSPPLPPPTAPKDVRDALRPSLSDLAETTPEGGEAPQRFDVAVVRAPVRSFLMNLVEGTREGMVVHPGVDGEVTMNLKSVTVAQVLETLREVHGFQYRRVDGGWEVTPARLETRVFHVDYLNVSRQGHSQTRVSSGQVSEQGESSSGSEGTNTGSSETSTLTGTHVETETAADFWSELGKTVAAIVGSGEGRSVMSSPHAGIVTVRAMPRELAMVEDYLDQAHKNLRRQVIIEAKILEVSLSDGYQQGINWSGVLGNSLALSQTGGGTTLNGGGTGLLDQVAPSDTAGNAGILDPAMLAMIQGAAASAFGGVFSIAVALDEFAAFIELLKTQGDVEVLSSPRISTLNNQKAVIKVGNDEFFVTDVSTTTVTGTATTTSPDVTLTPFFSGIALDVTPRIGEKDDITLHVHPAVSQVRDQVKQINLGAGVATLQLPLAFSTIRESDSIVRARSGQVIVIGGLIENVLDEKDARLPLLGDIPLIGGAFRQKRQVARKNELVILLRPEIVEVGGWSRKVDETTQRVRSMSRN